MTRTELIEAAKIVRTAVDISGLKTILEQALKQERATEGSKPATIDPHAVVKTMRLFFSFAESFGKAETKLFNALGLQHLLDVNQSFWGLLFNGDSVQQQRALLRDTYRAIQLATDKLPHIMQLLQQEGVEQLVHAQTQEGSPLADQDHLSVTLIENSGENSRPERLIEMLEGVSLLYEASSILEDQQGQALSVIACDSGSDKRFDFMGQRDVITRVKDIMVTVYKVAAFFPQDQRDNFFNLMSQQLVSLGDIARLEQERGMPTEQAAKLKRDVLNGAMKFLNAGATIPEMGAAIGIDARMVMAPEKKYLVAPQYDQDYQETAEQAPDADSRDAANTGRQDAE